ncbi:unnamed protein product [Camellia sinensis]
MASIDPEHREEEETTAADDEDTGAQVAPIVKLEEVAVTTGEEDEEAILDLKSKLYRFDKEGNQWKERGAGTVKLLKHKGTGKVRLVMRQSKTLKICANHLVLPTMSVQEHTGNEKSCVWHAADFADGELKDELFAIRFGSVERSHYIEGSVSLKGGNTYAVVRCGTSTAQIFAQSNESNWPHLAPTQMDDFDNLYDQLLVDRCFVIRINCKTFMEMFQEVAESQQKKEENKDASAAAARLLEKLSVEDERAAEDKASEEVSVATKEESESEAGKTDADK